MPAAEFEMIEQSADRPADRGMDHFAATSTAGFQNEAAKGHTRMRHDQLGRLDHPLGIQQQVEVDRAGFPALDASSSQVDSIVRNA